MICAYCGRPAAIFVMISGNCYHEECTHGPDWKPQYFTAPCSECARLRALLREAHELFADDLDYRRKVPAGKGAVMLARIDAALSKEGS